jgi:hypothetical protein
VTRGGHQLALGDHIVDLGMQVGEGLVDHAEELLGLLGVLAAEGMVNSIRGQQVVEGVQVPGVDDLLVEASRRLLVVLHWHAPSLPSCRGCPTATARTIAEAARQVYGPVGGWPWPRPSR